MKKIPLKIKEINKKLEKFQINLNKKDKAILYETENLKVIIVNNEPWFFYYEEKLLPSLKYLQTHEILKKITVDMGAIKFVINGADIMRPGIVEIEAGIEKDEFIVIIDEKNKKPLALGIALFEAIEMDAKDSGKVIKNIHYIGDEIWKLE